MKILFPTDGSAISIAALTALLDRRQWFADALDLGVVYVHLPLPYRRATAWAGKAAVDAYYEEEGEEALAGARKLLADRGVKAAFEKRIGEPAREIIALAQHDGYALIAMATHGHSALANLVLGSVATKVLAGSKVPVMFVK
jgi:nucleotide-binding universal stress UspA family protein